MNKRGFILTFVISLIIITVFLFISLNNVSLVRAAYNVSEDLNPLDWIGASPLYNLAYDSSNDLIYFVGISGLFGAYNKTSGVIEDLRGVDVGNWIGTVIAISDLTYDSSNGLVYLVGASGLFGAYNRTSNTTADLRATDPGNWVAQWNIRDLTYDSNRSLVYFIGDFGRFGFYNRTSNVTVNLMGTDAGDWIGNETDALYAVTYDSNRSLVYLTGTAHFGAYNITSNITENLSATDTGDWIGTSIATKVLTYDSSNGLVYVGGENVGGGSIFGAYNRTSNVTVDLRTTDTGNWIGSNAIYSLTYDPSKNLVYLGGINGIFGAYNKTSGITSDLRINDSWLGSSYVYSILYHPVNSLAYLAGSSGKFGFYNWTANYTEDLRNSTPEDWMGVSQLNGATYDSDRGLIYIAGDDGVFGAYNRTSDFLANLKTVDTNNWIGGSTTPNIHEIVYAPNSSLIYLVGHSEIFGFYNITSNVTTHLKDTDIGNWNSGNTLEGVTYDSRNRLLYFVGGFGKLGVYNESSNITSDLSATDTGDWIENKLPEAVVYDSKNDLVYLAGGESGGFFGVYNRASNITENLNETDINNWMGTTTIYDLVYGGGDLTYLAGGFSEGIFGVYDRALNVTENLTGTGSASFSSSLRSSAYGGGLVYFAGVSGKFGVYNRTSNFTEDLTETDAGDWIGTSTIYDLTYDSSKGLVYLVGASGKFGVYNRTANATIPAESGGVFEDNTSGGGVVITPGPGPKVNLEISAGAPTIINIANSSLTQFIITTNETVNATVSVSPTTKPQQTDLRIEANGSIYEAFRITTTGINDSNIVNVSITFKVNISWVEQNLVDPADVTLIRNEGTAGQPIWASLPTEFSSSDSQYYYYTAISPGFSDFAIFIAFTQCEVGAVRCFNDEVQLCVGNSTWVVSESCDGICVGNQCVSKEEGVIRGFFSGILTIFSGSAIFYIAVVLVSSGLIVVAYFMLRNLKKRRRK